MKSYRKSLFAVVGFLLVGFPASAQGLIAEIHTDKSRYQPSEIVTISVTLTNSAGPRSVTGTISLHPQHLETALPGPPPQTFHVQSGASRTFEFRWKPPARDFQGYRVEAQVSVGSVYSLRRAATAVDVSSTWQRFPRPGFLSGYPRQSRAVSRREIEALKNHHLNVLQFYDWQWKHQRPLAGTVQRPASAWNDIANRPVSRQTVLDCLGAAHEAGMAAMNYNLLYGAWHDSDGVNTSWGLFNDSKALHQDSLPMPEGWATPAIDLYNPANKDWQDHLLAQEAEVFGAYPFDGWQVDQVGERGLKYDVHGSPVTVWKTFRPFLNHAKTRLHKAIIFNNVGGYGLYDTAALSTEDAVYVECWPDSGQKTYAHLKTVIDQASSWSGGKGVILAAYLNYRAAQKASSAHSGRFNLPGVLLADAVIFACGGAHIELGDGESLLDSEYFPNHNLLPSKPLQKALAEYYDFMVAYENLLRAGLTENRRPLTIHGVPMSDDGQPNTVWAIAKSGGGYQVLQLINLLGEHDTDWRDDNADYPAPIPQSNLAVKYYVGPESVTQLYWASPDTDSGAAHRLAFTSGMDKQGNYVQFTLPSLVYWDMVYCKPSLSPSAGKSGFEGLKTPR